MSGPTPLQNGVFQESVSAGNLELPCPADNPAPISTLFAAKLWGHYKIPDHDREEGEFLRQIREIGHE